jgi:signal transduction histidine kinase
MAWTWSAPQRGTVASLANAATCQPTLTQGLVVLSRGDSSRTLAIAFAAFLTLAGAAAPLVSTTALTEILFLSGAAMVLIAGFLPSATTHSTSNRTEQPALLPAVVRHASTACLQELLQPRHATSACDRAAFARLTAHMSHELRTPLNAIIGFSELMSNEVFGPLGSSCYADYSRDIHTSGMSLLKSAEDALAITTLLTATEQNYRSSIANVAAAGNEALAFHAPALMARGINANCTIDPSAEILADAQAVRQLLINLISEAGLRAGNGATLSLASRQDNGQIEILISVSGAIAARTHSDDSFSMLLARTLSQLSSAQIIEDCQVCDVDASSWTVAVRFHSVTQNDFFSRAAA